MTPSAVLAVANQKGGVGKTTTSVNLAAALSATRRVLLVDLDPQGNASTHLGLMQDARFPGSYEWLVGEDLVRPRAIDVRLDLLPATVELAAAELELSSIPRPRHRLKERLAALEPPYDLVVIDCPPSLGLLTLNALAAATHLVIPLQCEFFALEGTAHLVRTVERLRRDVNPGLQVGGVLLTMYDRRNNLSELVATDARSFFGELMFETVIPRSIRLSEAPSHGQPIQAYDLKSPGAVAYNRLAHELLERLQCPT